MTKEERERISRELDKTIAIVLGQLDAINLTISNINNELRLKHDVLGALVGGRKKEENEQ